MFQDMKIGNSRLRREEVGLVKPAKRMIARRWMMIRVKGYDMSGDSAIAMLGYARL